MEMLFADIALAARIELAECRLLTDCGGAAARRRPDSQAFVQEIAGGVATYTGPDSPFNKLAGLGFGDAVDEEGLAHVERAFAERGAAVQAEVASLADPSAAARLTGRGYVLQNFENVLGLRLPADLPAAGDGIDVSIGDETEHEAWLDVIAAGFASPDSQGVPSHEEFSREVLDRTVGDMAAGSGFRPLPRAPERRPGRRREPARLRGRRAALRGRPPRPPIAAAACRGALLAARLADGARQGCDVAVVTTQPGSKSQQNVQRQWLRAALHARHPGAGGIDGQTDWTPPMEPARSGLRFTRTAADADRRPVAGAAGRDRASRRASRSASSRQARASAASTARVSSGNPGGQALGNGQTAAPQYRDHHLHVSFRPPRRMSVRMPRRTRLAALRAEPQIVVGTGSPGVAQRTADTLLHGARRLRQRRLVQGGVNLRRRPARQGGARRDRPIAVRRPAVNRQARPAPGRAARRHLDPHLGKAPRLVQPQLCPAAHRSNSPPRARRRAGGRSPPRPRGPAVASRAGRDRPSGRPA